MKVILKKTIHKLGIKNQMLSVSDGYARNYLIPTGIATEATVSMQKIHDELIKQTAHKRDIQKKEALDLASRLANISLEVHAKSGARGKIFAAVTPAKISEALQGQGVSVDKHNIFLSENIKNAGNYVATLTLFDGVSCKLNFTVIPA